MTNRWRKEAYTNYLLGHYDAARRAYETALEGARAADERHEMWRALVGLGEVAEAEGVGGHPDGLRRAERHFRQAAAIVEDIRRSYGTHDWSASAWETTQEPYLHLTRVLLRQGRAAEAFLVLDATRARHLRDLRTAARLRETLDVHAAGRLDSLTTALDDVRHDLGDPALPLVERTTLEAQEVTLRQEVDALIGVHELAADSLTLEAVQNGLQARGQVLLTYFLDDDLPTAFVVRADTFAAVPLRTRNEALHAEVRALGGLWAETGEPTVDIRLTPLHALYQALYAPVAALVPEGAPLVVIPDGPLAQVPFGLLLEENHDAYAYADAPYLVRRHPIATELAAALLAAPAPAHAPALDLLALGRSRFDGLPAERPGDARAPAPGSDARHALGDLPNVGEELQRLRRRFPNGRFALDAEATETLFDAHVGEARLVHLASHTLVNPQLPLYSRVVLSDDPNADDDGTLYLYELQDRALDADLVTLSGCGTARGRRRVGEGMMGLQYAFRAAGAHATLATLWPVDDAASAALMDRFYGHLRRGLPKDEALRQAQLDYLAAHDGRAASPFFWAAPVLYGSTEPVSFAPAGPSLARWAPLGLLLVLAGVALPRLAARRKRTEGEERVERKDNPGEPTAP
jgi:CHAT domain-containing protein